MVASVKRPKEVRKKNRGQECVQGQSTEPVQVSPVDVRTPVPQKQGATRRSVYGEIILLAEIPS